MEAFDGQGGEECKKNQTVSWEGYHKYPEITEIPAGWFLGQKTQLLCGLIWQSFNWIKKLQFTWV